MGIQADFSELKCLALAASVTHPTFEENAKVWNSFLSAAEPDVVLALIAEIEALRKEAERYRWLRDKSESGHSFYLSVPLWLSGIRFRKEDVDTGIDTAMGNGEQS